MFKKIFSTVTISSALGYTYCYTQHPIPLKCSLTTFLFKWLTGGNKMQLKDNEQQKEGTRNCRWVKTMLYLLIKHQFVNNSQESSSYIDLKGKILRAGFDIQGSLLGGLDYLGIQGIQIGPVSLTQQQDNLGILIPKANILTYHKQHKKGSKKLKIGVKLIPDAEVVQFTPYIIKQNLLNAMEKLLDPPNLGKKIININKCLKFITLDSSPQKMQGQNSNIEQNKIKSHNKLVKELVQQSQKLIKDTNISLYLISNHNNQRLKVYPKSNSNSLETISWRDIVNKIIE